MKIRVTLDIDYEPSSFVKDIYPEVVDQFLSDYDWAWMKDEGIISNAKAEMPRLKF